jgi:putative heme-binding domain-containing protein
MRPTAAPCRCWASARFLMEKTVFKRPKRAALWFGIVTLVVLLTPYGSNAQEQMRPPVTPDTIDRGHAFFANNCGICHGVDAHNGDKGPDLNTGHFKHAVNDADLFRVITHGVPGTIMPANDLPAEQVWAIIAFLRSTVVASRTVTGSNVAAGKAFFWKAGQCVDCHMVSGKGGVLGPDLSVIGGLKTIAYLAQKIRDPDKALTTGLREPNADYVVPISNSTVTVTTKEGNQITGIPRNEDTFTIQMIGTDNQLHNFLKKDLQRIDHAQKSLMPAYGEKQLSDADLKNVLAYLSTLKGGGE